MTDNFNIPLFCSIFVSRLITSIETRNVRFFTIVFSVKGMISVISILVVAVYQEILSSTKDGFIGLLRGNKTSMFSLGGGSCNFQPCFRDGSVIFVPKGGSGSCVFYQPHFQMLRPTPPLYFLTSPLRVNVRCQFLYSFHSVLAKVILRSCVTRHCIKNGRFEYLDGTNPITGKEVSYSILQRLRVMLVS